MMKIQIIICILILSVVSVSAQKNFSMGQDFLDLALSKGGTSGGLSAFQNYRSTDIDGSQFFLPGWSAGEVVTTRKETFNSEFEFLYDKVRQELFIKQKDSAMILLANKDEVQSFTLKDSGRIYNFVNSKLFNDRRPEFFYQVLLYDSAKFSLLKYIKTMLVKADLSIMINERHGKVYDAFEDTYYYYLLTPAGELIPVQLRAKNLRKAFAQLNLNCDQYLKSHPPPLDEEYLVKMIQTFNAER